MPISRAGLPIAARTGTKLFRCVLQSPRRSLPAHVLAPDSHEALRSSQLDDDRQARLVRGGISAEDRSYSANFACAGQTAASPRWPIVSGWIIGAGSKVILSSGFSILTGTIESSKCVLSACAFAIFFLS